MQVLKADNPKKTPIDVKDLWWEGNDLHVTGKDGTHWVYENSCITGFNTNQGDGETQIDCSVIVHPRPYWDKK
jgi:hypothetical protein